MDMQAFYRGESFDAHTYFGAHLDAAGDQSGASGQGAGTGDAASGSPSPAPRGATFRTFAPAAARVSVLLERDADTDPNAVREIPMAHVYDGNVWEAHADDVRPGDPYEYRVYHRDGSYTDHADPFAFGSDLRPRHRSIVRNPHGYRFSDDAWMAARTPGLDRPLNIYELHAGSWRKPRNEKGEEQPDLWYRYDELAQPLIDHCRAGGFTHVEFLPLTEYPADESWGYQPTGFFSPTSRYGTVDQLKCLIDRLHRAGIGAILDFVPVHFAPDAWGLAAYDGTPLFEYPNRDVGASEWGSDNFMHSRGEVRSFLQSAANWWLGAFHFDGLRLDAISRIIYWQGDERRGVNGSAVNFIKVMNQGLKQRNPGCLLAAEDSTNYPGVTRPVDEGGLGFDYKWDMGWMHDTLELFQTPPAERPGQYHKLTFSMMYYANERYLLPLSHDEVVHGKATVLQKMSGDYAGKFGQARVLYLYMAAHPGKMLNFMGSEFGQLREWDEKREQDWLLLSYPVHDAFWRFWRALGQVYRAHPALWARDYEADGFTWLDCHEETRVLYAFARTDGAEHVACVLNLSGEAQTWRVALSGEAANARGNAGGAGAANGVKAGQPGDGAGCAAAQASDKSGDAAGTDGGSETAGAGATAMCGTTCAGAEPPAAPEPEPEPAATLIYTDWQPFGGDTPDAENPCTRAGDVLICRLAANSGVLVVF